MDFNQNYHLNANALYIALRRQNKDNDKMDHGALFLHTSVLGNEFDDLLINDTERYIAMEMTAREKEMQQKLNISWNDGKIIDYESAMETLIESVEMREKEIAIEFYGRKGLIDWCNHCGRPFLKKYNVTKGKNVCCETCMKHMD